MTRFDELALTPDMLNAVAAMGFETPTPVQIEAIPLMLNGRDVLVRARTGTGKTAAFGIPLIEQARKMGGRGPVALVLTPTRELAHQVVDEIRELARRSPLTPVAVYGGTGFFKQEQDLRRPGPLVVVATPGRLLDHIQRQTIRLDQVRTAILDEADRMLDMGFLPDVERILSRLPKHKQTALFSATLPPPIQRVAERFMRDPALAEIESGPATTPLAEQFRVDVHREQKTAALLGLLQAEWPGRAVVFTRTKHLAKRLAERLDKSGWKSVALQGNMSQPARNRALHDFREGRAQILVATDVASRGLDVPEITHVINFDMPNEADVYVHRVGRTARMGRSGRAFTFVQPNERREIASIERTAGVPIVPFLVKDLPVVAPQAEGEREHRPSRGNRFRPRPHRGGGRPYRARA